jgi:hypothetical protein
VTMPPASAQGAPVPAGPTQKLQPTPTRRVTAPPGKRSLFDKGQNDVGGLSLPKFTSDTGAVVMLVAINMAWSIFRTFATAPNADPALGAAGSVHGKLVRITAGAWVVGLGLLIVHEIDPHVAMLLALLFVIGNVLANNAGNKAVISAFDTLFAGNGG